MVGDHIDDSDMRLGKIDFSEPGNSEAGDIKKPSSRADVGLEALCGSDSIPYSEKRELPLLFVIENSAHIQSERTDKAERIIDELLLRIKRIPPKSRSVKVKINILRFSDNADGRRDSAYWMSDYLIPIDEFYWDRGYHSTSSIRDSVFAQLDGALKHEKEGFLKKGAESPYTDPVIIIITN